MWFVYGLSCKDDYLYIGSTNSLKRRVFEHDAGKCLTSKNRLPCKLKFYIAVNTEKTARNLEKYLKTGSGKAILKKRILTDEASSKDEA
ncbi:MAG: GIY-YIG nuclease family protein [Patescibacteria group bacterium]|jgi:predicted GIY-YIG superfamily endonuclease